MGNRNEDLNQLPRGPARANIHLNLHFGHAFGGSNFQVMSITSPRETPQLLRTHNPRVQQPNHKKTRRKKEDGEEKKQKNHKTFPLPKKGKKVIWPTRSHLGKTSFEFFHLCPVFHLSKLQ